MTDKTFGSSFREDSPASTRRCLLRTNSGPLAAAILSATGWPSERIAQSQGNTPENKRKKRKKHKGVCRHLRVAGGATPCGDHCCAKRTHICCADSTDPSGKSCFPAGTEC